MRRLYILMTLCVFAAGCGNDSAEKIGTELVATRRDLVKVIAGVTDQASAKAAVPQIQAIYVRQADLIKRANGLPDAPKDVADRLDNEMLAADEEKNRSLKALKEKNAGAEAIVRDTISIEIRKLPK